MISIDDCQGIQAASKRLIVVVNQKINTMNECEMKGTLQFTEYGYVIFLKGFAENGIEVPADLAEYRGLPIEKIPNVISGNRPEIAFNIKV